MPAKKLIIWCLALMVASVSVLVITGCSPAARHKILTFFFEGVPPLGSQKRRAQKKTVVENEPDKPEEKKVIVRVAKQTDPSRHKLPRDCSKCHPGRMRSGQKELVKPLPQLCYSCHQDYSSKGDYLHGPVSVGACLFCHEGHKSSYIHLQKAPQPDLCYQCHIRQDVNNIPGHRELKSAVCTRCHDPHVSSERMLLKARTRSRPDANEVGPE